MTKTIYQRCTVEITVYSITTNTGNTVTAKEEKPLVNYIRWSSHI